MLNLVFANSRKQFFFKSLSIDFRIEEKAMDISTEGIWNLVLYHFHEDFALALLIAGICL